jgi:hypothetical protein
MASNIDSAFYAGSWRFYDDGWPGTLSLSKLGGNRLEGSFYSDRFRAEYQATAEVSSTDPRSVKIIFHQYNWLEKQEYSGYIICAEQNAIAGYSYWRSERFGFVAFQGDGPIPGNFRPGPVEPVDFSGDWLLNLDGKISDVELICDKGTGTLRGTRSVDGDASERFECLLLDSPAGHAMHLTISGQGASPSAEASLYGYLFTRPKSMISGHAGIDSRSAGFYLFRYR